MKIVEKKYPSYTLFLSRFFFYKNEGYMMKKRSRKFSDRSSLRLN